MGPGAIRVPFRMGFFKLFWGGVRMPDNAILYYRHPAFVNMLQKPPLIFYLQTSNAGDIMHLLENTVRKDGECSMTVNRTRAGRGWLPIGSRVLHFAGD